MPVHAAAGLRLGLAAGRLAGPNRDGRTGAVMRVSDKDVRGRTVSCLCRDARQLYLRSSSCCRTLVLLTTSKVFDDVGRPKPLRPSKFLDWSLTVPAVNRRLGIRFRNQMLLAATASALVATIFVLLNADRLDGLSKATAYVGLLYLAITLIIGPLNILRGAPNPVSTFLRRDFGIVAGVLALLHTVVGLQVHMRGDFVQYFFYRTPGGIGSMRFDIFGVANHLGLIASLIIFILLCISNNLSIRRLGPTGWKRIQSWNYIAAVLVVAHGLLYQLIERRMFAFVAYVLGVAAIPAVIQFLGFRRRSEELTRQPDFKSE